MKSRVHSFIDREMIRFITIAFVAWRILLEAIARIETPFVMKRVGFLGPSPWANFDGVHYTSIAERGYLQFQQAFFPLYPILMRFVAKPLHHDFVLAGIIISHVCFFVALILLWKLIAYIPHIQKNNLLSVQKWTIVSILAFPTSYYFISVYTESLFLVLILAAFYVLAQKQYVRYALFAAIASGVRLVGSFLLVPVGLFSYMYYLWKAYGDPLMFIHVQPAFGANRSGDELVILPQVLWRYMNIFIKVPVQNYDWWIALFELVCLIIVFVLLWFAWVKKYPRSWIYFSLAGVLLPTLSGTLSSMPRYVLVVFPMFIVIAQLPRVYRTIVLCISGILLVLCTLLFTHGYWIS